ncbi:MAG: 1-acyl-sn-glycerol-3-phosphate acyltransferase [Planctomycetes bacterium]|nr:1-acyl-sn-glycerol-3-phosphate acyltransferase [Planctomycetota bacterium]
MRLPIAGHEGCVSCVVKAIRWTVHLFMAFFHSVRFRGAHHVPVTGGVILAANHSSYLDPLALALGVPRWVRFFAKRSLLRIPFLGGLLRRFRVLPVIRGGDNERTVRGALRSLRLGHAIGIFPEGTRARGRTMGEVRPGIGRLAIESGVPVVPVAILGAWRAWPRTAALPRPARIVVVYHPPMRPRPGETAREFADRVRAVILGTQLADRRAAA